MFTWNAALYRRDRSLHCTFMPSRDPPVTVRPLDLHVSHDRVVVRLVGPNLAVNSGTVKYW